MRSWILIPAENDKAIGAAAGTGADAVVIDLARPLPPGLKAAARVACMEWLRAYRDQRQSEHKFARWARVPALDTATWREDLATAMAGSPHGIVLSQCHGPEDLRQLAAALDAIEDENGLAAGVTRIVPQLGSTPASALDLPRFADDLHPRVAALTWDAVGLAHAIGARRLRGPGGRWSDPLAHVRAQVLLIAHARGIDAIEHPVRQANDADAGLRIAEAARADGFSGMVAVHPAQVAWINHAFAPLEREMAEARNIAAAFAEHPEAKFLTIGDRRVERIELQRVLRLLGEN